MVGIGFCDLVGVVANILSYFCNKNWMKYQIGDDILVLHSNEEGKVVDIMNDKMVMIEVRGVKFPAYMDQIDFPYFYRFTKQKLVEEKKPARVFIDNVPKEKIQPNAIKVADGVWLCLIPKFALDDFNDEVVELLKVYLINRSETAYAFTYSLYYLDKADFELKNEIRSFHDFYLHDIPFENVNDSPSFHFMFTLLEASKKKADFFESVMKIKPKQLFQKIEAMKDENKPTITFKLFDTYPDKVAVEDRLELSSLTNKGYKLYDAGKIKQHLPPARTVVDLHIEKLSSNYQQLSNLEILSIQLNEFEKWYHLAVAHRQPILIIIHGVGKGKLKEEIHEMLKLKKEVKHFINQYDGRFGYGATEIFFKF